jgi:hypothetical protein
MTQSPGPTMATTLTRQVRTGWYHDAAGGWAYEGVDDHLWEVFCQQCGDTDGPAENQEPAVRQLRGPYRYKHGGACREQAFQGVPRSMTSREG